MAGLRQNTRHGIAHPLSGKPLAGMLQIAVGSGSAPFISVGSRPIRRNEGRA